MFEEGFARYRCSDPGLLPRNRQEITVHDFPGLGAFNFVAPVAAAWVSARQRARAMGAGPANRFPQTQQSRRPQPIRTHSTSFGRRAGLLVFSGRRLILRQHLVELFLLIIAEQRPHLADRTFTQGPELLDL